MAVLCPGLTRTEFQDVANETKARNLPDLAWQTADEVAEAGLSGLRAGKVVIVPGLHNKALAGLAGVTPPGVLRRVTALGQRLRGA